MQSITRYQDGYEKLDGEVGCTKTVIIDKPEGTSTSCPEGYDLVGEGDNATCKKVVKTDPIVETPSCPEGTSNVLKSNIIGDGYGKLTCESSDVSKATCSISGNVLTINANTEDKVTITVTESNANKTAKYIVNKSYTVGDDIVLSDGTTWVILKIDQSTIDLISSSYIKNNLTNETGTAMFTTVRSEYRIQYDGQANYLNDWNASTLKKYLDTTVQTRLEESLNTKIIDVTILGPWDLEALGCTMTGNYSSGYASVGCDKNAPWYSKVFNMDSWTWLPYARRDSYVWNICEGGFSYNRVDGKLGARPVITISKSGILE